MGAIIGDRALVLGGSVTGLFAASALAESYRQVILVDRDKVVGVRGARRGAPQGRHINGLLARGQLAMEELMPGITAQMSSAGVPLSDLAGTVRWYFNGRRLRQISAGITCVAATRPVMEAFIRERVECLPNVTFVEERDILGLETTPDRARVTGAKVQRQTPDAKPEVLEADLVIDATGRGSRTHLWLEKLGYGQVEEDATKIGLGYATRHYRLRYDPFGTDLSIVSVASPQLPRGAIFTKTDSGRVELTTYGILGDHPPTDPEGFTAFAGTLAAREIYDAIIDAEALDDPVIYRFPTTLRRRYERLTRLPEGLVVMGDAVCTPNPVFAQAQSLAALEAVALRRHLRQGTPPQPVAFMRDVAKIIDPAWDTTTGVDLSFPGVEGERPLKLRLGQAYIKRLQLAATQDATLTRSFMRVAGLIDPPEGLMRPSLILRVLWKSRRASVTGTSPAPTIQDQEISRVAP